jgi:hypothetical protein
MCYMDQEHSVRYGGPLSSEAQLLGYRVTSPVGFCRSLFLVFLPLSLSPKTLL